MGRHQGSSVLTLGLGVGGGKGGRLQGSSVLTLGWGGGGGEGADIKVPVS